MISFRRLGVILAHELRLATRDPLPVMVLLVFPLVTIAFLKPAFQPALAQTGYTSANGAEQVVPGQATMSAFFVVSLVSFGFFTEFGWATWDRLRASAATSFEVVLGKGLPRMAMAMLQFAIIFAAGVLVFGLEVRGDALALLPIVFSLSLCLVALGVVVTALCRTAQQAQACAVAGMVVFGALGGAMVPITVLPDWARTIAPVTPTYWAMRGFRSVVLDGHGLDRAITPVAVLLGMSVVCALVASWRLRFDETKVAWT